MTVTVGMARFSREPKIQYLPFKNGFTVLDFREFNHREEALVEAGFIVWEYGDRYWLSERFDTFIQSQDIKPQNLGINGKLWLPLCIKDFVLDDQQLMLFKLQFG